MCKLHWKLVAEEHLVKGEKYRDNKLILTNLLVFINSLVFLKTYRFMM